MRFIVYMYKDSVKIMFLISCARLVLESTTFMNVYALTKVCVEAHVIATHSRLYMLPVLQTVEIVYIDYSHRSNTIVSTE